MVVLDHWSSITLIADQWSAITGLSSLVFHHWSSITALHSLVFNRWSLITSAWRRRRLSCDGRRGVLSCLQECLVGGSSTKMLKLLQHLLKFGCCIPLIRVCKIRVSCEQTTSKSTICQDLITSEQFATKDCWSSSLSWLHCESSSTRR